MDIENLLVKFHQLSLYGAEKSKWSQPIKGQGSHLDFSDMMARKHELCRRRFEYFLPVKIHRIRLSDFDGQRVITIVHALEPLTQEH